MASIECQIVFENKTKSNLDLIKKSVEHGVFLSDPPAKIPVQTAGLRVVKPLLNISARSRVECIIYTQLIHMWVQHGKDILLE